MKRLLLILTAFMFFSLMSLAQKNTIEKPKIEAKKLSKAGYEILPDALYPMKKQLTFVYDNQTAKDEVDGSKKYLMGTGIATNASLEQAKISARENAVQEIIHQLMAPMKSIIEKNGGIQEKVSLTEILAIVENNCKQKMMSGPTLAVFYKKEKGNYVVKRYCTYSYKEAQSMAINFFEKELKNESEKLKNALRNSANWN
ncbi:MAG: hypothetical protein J6X43_03045 [Bacteroidales bacterium]|nr:hypothetical protein [Bacteroidales bacterium]